MKGKKTSRIGRSTTVIWKRGKGARKRGDDDGGRVTGDRRDGNNGGGAKG